MYFRDEVLESSYIFNEMSIKDIVDKAVEVIKLLIEKINEFIVSIKQSSNRAIEAKLIKGIENKISNRAMNESVIVEDAQIPTLQDLIDNGLNLPSIYIFDNTALDRELDKFKKFIQNRQSNPITNNHYYQYSKKYNHKVDKLSTYKVALDISAYKNRDVMDFVNKLHDEYLAMERTNDRIKRDFERFKTLMTETQKELSSYNENSEKDAEEIKAITRSIDEYKSYMEFFFTMIRINTKLSSNVVAVLNKIYKAL